MCIFISTQSVGYKVIIVPIVKIENPMITSDLFIVEPPHIKYKWARQNKVDKCLKPLGCYVRYLIDGNRHG